MVDTSAPSATTNDPFADAKKPGEPPPEVERDRWGRYLLPHPDTGKVQSWTRATTFAKTIADMYNIDLYHQRLVAKGMAMRPDLYAEAAGTHLEDKKKLNEIADYAREAAGESAKARLGTALHTFTEKYDLGEKQTVPPPWDKDVEAYAQCLKDHDITVLKEYVEATVVIPKFGVAGTLDRLAKVKGLDLPVVDDLKSGKSVEYAWMEIACQLYLYSQAAHIYDHQTQELREMPKVDQERGLVVHLPVGEANATVYEIDLELGARVAAAASAVRELRKLKTYSAPWNGATTTPLAIETSSGDSDDFDDWGDDDKTTSTNDSKSGDTTASTDDWDVPSDPPPAPATSTSSAKSKKSAPVNEGIGRERWEELGVDTQGARYQLVKVARQHYLLVDVEHGVSEEFTLQRDAKTRKKELESGDDGVRPLGMSEQDWEEQRGLAASSEALRKTENDWDDDNDDKAKSDQPASDDDWDDDPDQTADEVAKLKDELTKLRPNEKKSEPVTTDDFDEPADKEEPVPAATRRQWLAEIGEANSREELLKIHSDVKAAGETWTDRMTVLAKARQAELDAAAAKEADDDDDW